MTLTCLHLYGVNFEVNYLKPFPHLAFRVLVQTENRSRQLGFDGELMAALTLSRTEPRAASTVGGVMAMLRQPYAPKVRTQEQVSPGNVPHKLCQISCVRGP